MAAKYLDTWLASAQGTYGTPLFAATCTSCMALSGICWPWPICWVISMAATRLAPCSMT